MRYKELDKMSLNPKGFFARLNYEKEMAVLPTQEVLAEWFVKMERATGTMRKRGQVQNLAYYEDQGFQPMDVARDQSTYRKQLARVVTGTRVEFPMILSKMADYQPVAIHLTGIKPEFLELDRDTQVELFLLSVVGGESDQMMVAPTLAKIRERGQLGYKFVNPAIGRDISLYETKLIKTVFDCAFDRARV